MSDTIAAISTPPGEGGIGIVRISGPDSLSIMKKIFQPCPEKVEARRVYFGNIIRTTDGQVLDEAICFYMKAPHSYTCEDVVEIQAHGGVYSLQMILRNVLSAGARMAEPGEFTKLAFMNGRIDLEQAEAVIDVIKAKSELPLGIAERQLSGRLGTEIRDIRASILDILAQMTVNIDFPDEDIEQEEVSNFIQDLTAASEHVKMLLDTSDNGRIVRDGIRVAIVGRPNVGKSSLLNALLGENRAIVTNIPGTTRDTIEETVNIGGVPLVLKDTAGMRDTEDQIEQIGIERSREEMEAADLVVLVLDGSHELEEEDHQLIEEIGNRRCLVVINKEDLGTKVSIEEISSSMTNSGVVITSLLSLDGADVVISKIQEMFMEGILSMSERNIITNERHRDALARSYESLQDSVRLLQFGESIEISEIQVHSAYESLGEIIGEAVGDEILDTVFSRFCLGK